MEKLILKDKTEILVEGGMTENHFETIVTGYDEMQKLYNSLTNDNLSEFEVLNDAGVTCAVIKNKTLSRERRFETIEGTENIRAKVILEDVDTRDVRLSANEAKLDYLVMMQDM